MKIRLQLQTNVFGEYKGATSTVISIIKNEGVRALWKGNVPAEIMYIIYGGVQFTSYSILSKALAKFEDDNSHIKLSPSTHSLIVGSGAGLSSTLATYPFDLLRTRLAAHTSREFLSITSTIKEIRQTQGLRGFYTGMRPAMISVTSTTGLMFWAYEIARDVSNKYKGDIPFIEGICGFVAGAVSKGITFPLDTLRKRMQMYSVTNGPQRVSSFKLMANILSKEGMFGFYKGYGISVLKTAPTSALSLFMYEYSLGTIRSFEKKLE